MRMSRFIGVTKSNPPKLGTEGATLELNAKGWMRLSAAVIGGTYSDQAIAPKLGLNPSTVYRVRTRRLAPGPTFIAAALTVFGMDKFNDLFEVVAANEAA